jgi:hypothetical protein
MGTKDCIERVMVEETKGRNIKESKTLEVNAERALLSMRLRHESARTKERRALSFTGTILGALQQPNHPTSSSRGSATKVPIRIVGEQEQPSPMMDDV